MTLLSWNRCHIVQILRPSQAGAILCCRSLRLEVYSLLIVFRLEDRAILCIQSKHNSHTPFQIVSAAIHVLLRTPSVLKVSPVVSGSQGNFRLEARVHRQGQLCKNVKTVSPQVVAASMFCSPSCSLLPFFLSSVD